VLSGRKGPGISFFSGTFFAWRRKSGVISIYFFPGRTDGGGGKGKVEGAAWYSLIPPTGGFGMLSLPFREEGGGGKGKR